jgi:hypothetical protein
MWNLQVYERQLRRQKTSPFVYIEYGSNMKGKWRKGYYEDDGNL